MFDAKQVKENKSAFFVLEPQSYKGLEALDRDSEAFDELDWFGLEDFSTKAWRDSNGGRDALATTGDGPTMGDPWVRVDRAFVNFVKKKATRQGPKMTKGSSKSRCERGEICSGCKKAECVTPNCTFEKGKCKSSSTARPASRPAPMSKTTTTKTHGTASRLSARAYYDKHGRRGLGDRCDIRQDGEYKCLKLLENGTPQWKPCVSGKTCKESDHR